MTDFSNAPLHLTRKIPAQPDNTWASYKYLYENPACSGPKNDKNPNDPRLLKENNTGASSNNSAVLKSTTNDKNIISKKTCNYNQTGVAKEITVQRLAVATSKTDKTGRTLSNHSRPSQCKELVPIKHQIPPESRNLSVQTNTDMLNKKNVDQHTKPNMANKKIFQQVVPFPGESATPLGPPKDSRQDPQLQRKSARNSRGVPMKMQMPEKALLVKSKLASETKNSDSITHNMLVNIRQKPQNNHGDLIQETCVDKKLEIFHDKVHQKQQKGNFSRKEAIEKSVETYLTKLPVMNQALALPAPVKKPIVVNTDVTSALFSDTKKIYKRIKTLADKQMKDAQKQRKSVMNLPSFKRKPTNSGSIRDAKKKSELAENESIIIETSTEDTSMPVVSVMTTKNMVSTDVPRLHSEEDANKGESKQEASKHQTEDVITKRPQMAPTIMQTTTENSVNEDNLRKRKLIEWELSQSDLQESSRRKSQRGLDQRSDFPANFSGQEDHLLPSTSKAPEVNLVRNDVIDEVIDLVGDDNVFVPYNQLKSYKPPKTTNKSSRPLYDFELYYGLAGPQSAKALKYRSSLIPDVPWSTPAIARHSLFFRRKP